MNAIQATERKTRYRWVILALLFMATTINYIDRQILSLLKPVLDEEIGWTNQQFGMINSAFQGAYAVGLLGFGWFIDKYGTKLGYSISIAWWSLAAALHGFVSSLGGFLNARLWLGIGEGGNFPGAVKTVAQWFPKKERAFATSIFNSGSNIGALLAPATIPLIAVTWGWQSAFWIAGGLGFIWIVFWLICYKAPQEHSKVNKAELDYITSDVDEHDEDQKKIPWGSLLKYRQTWSFIVGKFLTDPVWYFYLIWLPDYFNKSHGMDLKNIGAPLITIYAIIMVLSIMGGWLPGLLSRRGLDISLCRRICLGIFAVCALSIILVRNTENMWLIVCLIGFAGAAHQAWSANLFTTVSDMFPKNAVASVSGIGGMAGALSGIAFPIFVGNLVDKMGASAYNTLFIMCGTAYIVAYIINYLLAPRFARVQNIKA